MKKKFIVKFIYINHLRFSLALHSHPHSKYIYIASDPNQINSIGKQYVIYSFLNINVIGLYTLHMDDLLTNLNFHSFMCQVKISFHPASGAWLVTRLHIQDVLRQFVIFTSSVFPLGPI